MDGSTFKYITEIIDNMCIPRTVVHFISGKLIVRLTSILTGLVEFNQASISVVHFNLLNPNKPNWRSAIQINFPLRICDYSHVSVCLSIKEKFIVTFARILFTIFPVFFCVWRLLQFLQLMMMMMSFEQPFVLAWLAQKTPFVWRRRLLLLLLPFTIALDVF